MEEMNHEQTIEEPSPQKKDKKFWILIVLFIIGLILVVGWYIYIPNSVEPIPTADAILFGIDAEKECGPQPPALCGGGVRLGCDTSSKQWACYEFLQ